MIKMVNFIFCVFYHNKRNQWNSLCCLVSVPLGDEGPLGKQNLELWQQETSSQWIIGAMVVVRGAAYISSPNPWFLNPYNAY